MKKKFIIIISLVSVLAIAGICSCLLLFTEVFYKKTLPTSIKSITVNYIPGNNLDCDKAFIKKQKVKLTNSDIRLVKPLLKSVKKNNKKKEIVGKFEVVVNKDTYLYINEDSSYVVRNKVKENTSFNKELYDVLYYIVSEKQDKKHYKKIDFSNAILKKTGSSIKITNKNNLSLLKKHARYTKIEPNEEDLKTFGDVLLELNLDDKYTISIFNNNLAGIKDIAKNEFFFAVVDEKLFDTGEAIYTLSTENDKKEN